jgi:hypothetical protein
MFSLKKPEAFSLVNQKLSSILLTIFSDVFFEIKNRKSLRKTGSFFLGEPEVKVFLTKKNLRVCLQLWLYPGIELDV